MSNDSTAPDPKLLRQLHGLLPQMAKDVVAKKIGGKGKGLRPFPSHCCKICGEMFGTVMREKMPEPLDIILDKVCPACQKQLDDGWTALCCGENSAWINPKDSPIADLAGKVIDMKPKAMETVVSLYKLQVLAKKRAQRNGHE